MRPYILGAAAWFVIIARFAMHALQRLPRRIHARQTLTCVPLPPSPASDLLDPDIDPRIARIINDIPRRRIRRHA